MTVHEMVTQLLEEEWYNELIEEHHCTKCGLLYPSEEAAKECVCTRIFDNRRLNVENNDQTSMPA